MRRLFCILFTLHFSLFTAWARSPQVSASFDRDSILIGDRFTLEIRIDKDMMQVVDFPSLNFDDGTGDIEFLGEGPVDTLSVDGRRQILSRRYPMTIWREGNYNLGRVPALFADKNVVDTLLSADSLRIVVTTFDINLESDRPFDITPPLKVPFRFGEISLWLALGLVVVALLVLFGLWLLTRDPRRPLFGGDGPKLPPHLEAIRRLEALRDQKLPQNNKHKQYYSGLTDILRAYLEGRFGIGAMEMTSAEILSAIEVPRSSGEIDAKRFEDLSELLHTADLVKFAKFTPDAAYAESAYYNAYYFVEETKLMINE